MAKTHEPRPESGAAKLRTADRSPVSMSLALSLCIVGCTRAAPPPANDDSPVESAPAPIATPRYAAYDGPLVAGGDRGVFLLDARGAIQTQLSDQPGLRPRWLRPGESLLVLRRGETLALVEIDLVAGSERVIAGDLVGDAFKCPAGSVNKLDDELEPEVRDDLEVQDGHHFGTHPELGLACVWLMDRNFNMHNLAVEAKVRLADGVVFSTQLRAYHCEPAPNEVDDDPECGSIRFTVANPSPSEAELESMGPFHVGDGALWRRRGATDELIAGPFPERIDPETDEASGLASFVPVTLSPSGRWAVLTGNPSEGDYFHAQWLLLDTSQGELFSVSGPTPTWPAPLSVAALARLDRETVNNDIVPESTKVWLSGDRLVIDRWLIIPGEAVVELPGALAR